MTLNIILHNVNIMNAVESKREHLAFMITARPLSAWPSAPEWPLVLHAGYRRIDVLCLDSTWRPLKILKIRQSQAALSDAQRLSASILFLRSAPRARISSRDRPALDPLLGRSHSATPVCNEIFFERLQYLFHQKLVFLTSTQKVLRNFLYCDSESVQV